MSRARAQPFALVCARAAPGLAERVAAEVWAAGANGLEEREEDAIVALWIYAPIARAAAVREAAVALLGETAVSPIEPVAEVDWPETWKRDLRPIEVSPRLVVRPPFAAFAPAAGQHELLIEPRQAFGTGSHASTGLALAALDAVLAVRSAEHVLDVGCGSGVLALAALRLGARRAVACDVDPLAAREAADNARRNELGERLAAFVGTLAALRASDFDLVLANLLRSELAPLLPDLIDRLRRGGALVLSGLLASERAWAERALAELGARVDGVRQRGDERGDQWISVTASR